MKCSGSYNCDCTSFHPKKSSSRCKACSHHKDHHHRSGSRDDDDSNDNGDNNSNNDSDDDSNDNGDDNNGNSNNDDNNNSDDDIVVHPTGGNGRKRQPKTKNKTRVSALIAELIQGGEYTNRQVEGAKNEVNIGLTKRCVGSFLELYITAKSHQNNPGLSGGTKDLRQTNWQL